ncbi:MAG: hypothetical protein WAU47_07850 [Desulfobaccales bacterium]
MMWPLLAMWLLAWGGQELAAAPPRLNQVVYITLSKACGCLLDKCKAGDGVVDKVFVGERQGLLKRIDYSTDKATAKEYIGKYRLTIPPSLLFLDAQGNLIWRADGDVDYDLVLEKLKEFGA